MAKKVRSSGMSAAERIKKTNARKESRNAKPKDRSDGLPDGIRGGIAKLTRIDFDLVKEGDNKGKQRCYCHGVLCEPVEHDGFKLEGKMVRPSGNIVLDDDKDFKGNERSFEDNVKRCEERLKYLGFPTEEFDELFDDTLDYFNNIDEPMYFKFRTWKPEGSDMVLTLLEGPATDYEGAEASDDVQDDTESDEEADEEAEEEADDEPAPVTAKQLRAYAKSADDGNSKSETPIVQAAKEAGVDFEDPKYANWAAVVEAVLSAVESGPDGEAEEADADEVEPSVGDVFGYRPPRARKDKECEVMKVLKSKQVVTLRSIEDDAEYSSVPFKSLIMMD